MQIELEAAYRSIMLEEEAPDSAIITRCFVLGNYYYKAKGFDVSAVKGFVHLLKAASIEQKRIILANLHTRLDKVARYSVDEAPDNDIPF